MRQASEPLVKVTLNLFAADVEYFKKHYEGRYTEVIREDVRKMVRKRQAARLEMGEME